MRKAKCRSRGNPSEPINSMNTLAILVIADFRPNRAFGAPRGLPVRRASQEMLLRGDFVTVPVSGMEGFLFFEARSRLSPLTFA
jgi:hypothetical protein